MAKPVSNRGGFSDESGNGGANHPGNSGFCLSIVADRPDLTRSQFIPLGGRRRLPVSDRSVVRDRHRLRVTVCLGIAVDDTIHFLTRYQDEMANCDDEQTAIRNAFTGVGTALILTTIVLVAGFSTVLFSDGRDQIIFASMGIITLSAALFADLVFLPALLARFAKPNKQRSSE